MSKKPQNIARIAALESSIGHNFVDRGLIERALTHVSFLHHDLGRVESYQRLEFLGDRVLGLAISDMLYQAFPDAEEGELSRRLADLVRKESCAEVALEWGVSDHVRLGEGEAQSGGASKSAILGDLCEAIIGAVFLDGGYEAARGVVFRAWTQRMTTPRRPLRDAKTALQEWAQGRGLAAPVYREINRSGPAHAPHFLMGVVIDKHDIAQAQGNSKRAAEQAAAEAFLDREGLLRKGAA